MFKCNDCGLKFEEPETWREYMGECHGAPAYEEWSGCPMCHGGYSEYENGEDEEE